MNRNFLQLQTCLLLLFALLGLLATPALAGGGPPADKAAGTETVKLRGDAGKARAGWERINAGALLIDVRSAEEYESGHIEGSLNIPHSNIDALAQAIGSDPDRSVVFYCGSGARAGRAINKLESLGYSNIYNASGLDALEATRP